MISRRTSARLLLALYPASWRAEYGEELLNILLARPLSVGVVFDVALNALRQRVKVMPPSTVLGLVSLVFVLASAYVAAPAVRNTSMAMVRPTNMTWPTLEVTFMSIEPYVWLLVWSGCWTQMRYRRTVLSSAIAAMRMSLIAGLPVIVAGLASVTRETTFFAVILAPIARLPYYAIWGFVGGSVGHWVVRRRDKRRTA